MSETFLEVINPILSVKDIAASLRYCEQVLGFRRANWVKDGDTFALVQRDHAGIYLCQGEQGHAGTWLWIGVGDATALHEEFKSRGGATIVQPPTNYPWALEFRVADPDGHVLRFGSDSPEE